MVLEKVEDLLFTRPDTEIGESHRISSRSTTQNLSIVHLLGSSRQRLEKISYSSLGVDPHDITHLDVSCARFATTYGLETCIGQLVVL